MSMDGVNPQNILQIYLQWYQQYTHPPFTQNIEKDYLEMRPDSLTSAVSYWATVAKAEGDYRGWVCLLSWPRCGLRCRRREDLQYYPRFSGHVLYDARELSEEDAPIDSTLANLPNRVTAFALRWCSTVTDAGFQHLSNLKSLDISMCNSEGIRDSAFQHLSCLSALKMTECPQETITDSAFVHLTGLSVLDMRGCCQSTITDSTFKHLTNLTYLNMSWCSQESITNVAFKHFSNLRKLSMRGCQQITISDLAFRHLSKLQTLDMASCSQSTITDYAFRHLASLEILNLNMCGQEDITREGLKHYLQNVTYSRKRTVDMEHDE